jgi:hypothetical protein
MGNGPNSTRHISSNVTATASRHVLPNDLPAAVKHLEDQELEQLLDAVVAERLRRGMKSPVPEKTPSQRTVDAAAVSLNLGRLNAVRAAFKAGVTPSKIAKEFGISQADVRKVIASEGLKRWASVGESPEDHQWLAAIRDFMSAHRSWTHSFTDDLIDLMRKSLRLSSMVTAAFLALCSASGSNAEPDAAIEHAAAPVEAAQGPNMTVADRDANVSTAQTENDAAKNLSAVSIAPNTSCDTLNNASTANPFASKMLGRNPLCSALLTAGRVPP